MSATAYHDLVVDDITRETLAGLRELTAPVVSLYLPTHRAQPNLAHDALTLRALAEEAAGVLRARVDGDDPAAEPTDPDSLLAPVYALAEDRPFWAEQGEGLAVFAAPSGLRVFRTPTAMPRRCVVGDVAHVVPLIPLVTGGQSYLVLALSQGRVRLLAGTRSTIQELALGPIPASLADMERRSAREPQLQHQHEPHGSMATFHGHGGADDAEIALRHFILEVAEGVRARVGADDGRPVVLAAVAEYLPLLQRTGLIPGLLPEVLAGNHDETAPHVLLEGAWPLVDRAGAAERDGWRARAAESVGTGWAVHRSAEIAGAVAQARVATLLVDPDGPGDGAGTAGAEEGRRAAGPAFLDECIAGVLATSGEVYAVPGRPDDAPAVAILRYRTDGEALATGG